MELFQKVLFQAVFVCLIVCFYGGEEGVNQ